MSSSNFNNVYPKFRHSYNVKDVDIFDHGSYVIIKHKNLICPENSMVSALSKKRLRLQKSGLLQYVNLQIEPYNGEEEHYKSPNTVKLSFASIPDGLTADEINKNLLKLVHQFLSKRRYVIRQSFFSTNYYGAQTNLNQQSQSSYETMEFSQKIEKKLQEIDKEIMDLREEQNRLVMRIETIIKKMSIKQRIKYPDLNVLSDEIKNTVVNLIDALKNASSVSLLNSFLDTEIENFRQQLANMTNRESSEVSSQEVLAHFGRDYIDQHLLNAKEQFIANQANFIQMLKVKLKWLFALESQEQNLHQLLYAFETDYANLNDDLKNLELKINAKMNDRDMILAQVSYNQLNPESFTTGTLDTEGAENNNNRRQAS